MNNNNSPATQWKIKSEFADSGCEVCRNTMSSLMGQTADRCRFFGQQPRYALHGDFDSLAASLGNSPAISRKHYIAPATRKEAEQFLQLTPEKIQAVLQLQNDSNPPASDTK